MTRMKPPEDRTTPVVPPKFGVEDNDRDELAPPVSHDNGNGDVSPYDMDALVEGFRKLPVEEQTKRLLMLYLANQGDDGLTRRHLADHKLEDKHEFDVINDELEYQGRCLDLLMRHFDIEPPPRPKERPRRKEE